MEDELKFIFVNGRKPQITLIENHSMIAGYVTLWVKIQNKIYKCSAM